MTLDFTKRFLKDVAKIKNAEVRRAITDYLELVQKASTIAVAFTEIKMN